MNKSNKHSSLYPTNFSQPNQHIGSTYHNNNHLVNSKSNSSPSLSSNSSLALFDDHEDEDDLNNKFMSIILERDRIGISCYDFKLNSLSVSEFWEYKFHSTLSQLLLQISPTVVITNSQTLEILREILKSYKVKVVSNWDFATENAPKLVEKIIFHSENDKSNLMIAKANPLIVRSMGGLIGFLMKTQKLNNENIQTNQNRGSDFQLILNTFHIINMEGVMKIDQNAFQSLQIFKTEEHPSSHSIGKSKEGLSLYGIMNTCVTAGGKRLLKQWLLVPIVDRTLIEDRLNVVSYFVNNFSIIEILDRSLKEVKDISRILGRVQTFRSSVTDWISLFMSFIQLHRLFQILRNSEEMSNLSIVSNITENLIDRLQKLATKMNETIDFDESKIEGRLIPKNSIDQTLDEYRETYAHLGEFLTEFGKEEFYRYNSYLITAMKCVYYPQIGFQIAIPILSDKIEMQISLGDHTDLVYQFHTEEFVYYKNPRVDELDEHIGDIYSFIVDLENRIIRKLEAKIINHVSELEIIATITNNIDCHLAFAKSAKNFKWNKPSLSDENVIYIQKGRHPLQELCVTSFISNDISIASYREGKVKIITGPNNSGKSVFMKQIAIICYLAMIGSYVPAESALIGLIDQIHTRLCSFESSSNLKSSFMIDCLQISQMLKLSTKNSLLVIDEFGKGTSSFDGVALMASLINHFLRMDEKCPKVLISTHFLQIFTRNLIMTNSSNYEHLRMSILSAEQNDSDEPVFLYRAEKADNSQKFQSLGGFCASIAGISSSVIDRSKSYSIQRFFLLHSKNANSNNNNNNNNNNANKTNTNNNINNINILKVLCESKCDSSIWKKISPHLIN